MPIRFSFHRLCEKLSSRLLPGLACLAMAWLLAMGALPAPAYALEHSQAPPLPKSALQQPAGDSSYWIWLVLPRLFPEYLPEAGGYLSLGFAWVPGHESPVGIAKTPPGPLGESRQHLDCLACHQSSPSASTPAAAHEGLADTEPAIVKTAFQHSAYADFLKRCAEDSRFAVDYVLPFIRYNHPVSWWKGLYYRWHLIPQARRSFLALSTT